jgi:hypothetical protein
MNIEPEDLRLIERLRADERRWPVVRWFYLLMGCSMIIVGGRFYLHAIQFVKEDPQLGFAVAVVALPVIPLAWCFGAILIREAFHKWGGDPTRRLLLKLLDSAKNDSVRQNHL